MRRIRREGRVLPGGLLKVDGFLNHRLEPALTLAMGRAFQARFAAAGATRPGVVLTAETSGIGPAFATAVALDVPVVYARKTRPATLPGPVLEARAPSRTKGGTTPLIVSPELLPHGARVLIIDDFLARGHTIGALVELIMAADAQLVGIGAVIEKSFEDGRARLADLGVPVLALAVVEALHEADGRIEVRAG